MDYLFHTFIEMENDLKIHFHLAYISTISMGGGALPTP